MEFCAEEGGGEVLGGADGGAASDEAGVAPAWVHDDDVGGVIYEVPEGEVVGCEVMAGGVVPRAIDLGSVGPVHVYVLVRMPVGRWWLGVSNVLVENVGEGLHSVRLVDGDELDVWFDVWLNVLGVVDVYWISDVW